MLNTQKTFIIFLLSNVIIFSTCAINPLSHDFLQKNGMETDITGNMVGHMLSEEHVKKGLNLLGNSNNERFMKIVDVLEQVGNSNLLKAADNQIETIINGQELTIKAYMQNGTLTSINAFSGFSKRKLGNLIRW